MPKKLSYSTFAGFLLLITLAGNASGFDSVQQDQTQDTTKSKRSVTPRGSRSLVEDVFANPRHRIGFSIGTFEVYQNNLYQTNQNLQTAASATVTTRVFVNLGRRKSKFHLDYGTGYQFYNNRRSLNGLEQQGAASYNYPLSRNVTLDIHDIFSSSRNGYASILSSIFAPSYSGPGYVSEIILQRQRITANNLMASLSYSAHKNSISIFGAYSLYRFGAATLQDVDGFSVGATYGRQITKWLSLSSGYSGYLNRVDPVYQNATINRLQVGGLRFKLSTGWQMDFGGGVELANTYGHTLWREDATASLAWNSPSHMFAIRYHRGFYTTVGVSGVFQSDQAGLVFGSRLTQRLNLQVSTWYLRGSNFYSLGTNTHGGVDHYSAMGGLQFSLFQGLIASANFTYRNQRVHGIAGLPGSLDALVAFAGLQYVFPSQPMR